MHEDYMRMAIKKAKEGRDSYKGGPFGALVVKNDGIISQAYNLVEGKDDLTQHAELLAIQKACKKLGRKNLQDCILYTSCEPCMMCLGACHWADFKSIYYGASALDAKDNGFVYSDAFFSMNSQLRHTEFRMNQLLTVEAVEVWKHNL